jgi:hypothetical protein
MAGRPNFWAAKGNALKVTAKLRSGLEDKVQAQLQEAGITFDYEKSRYNYQTEHKYIPDFQLPNGIIVECKGRFMPEDRTKHLAVKKFNPDLDIRFVFSCTRVQNPLTPHGANSTAIPMRTS